MTVDSRLGRRLSERETLIGSSPKQLRRLGVDLHPRAVSASQDTVSFADGTELRVDAVVWATGYQPDYSWIEAPVLDAGGRVRHHRGVTDLPGLYFLGLHWQHTRGSALLGWVKDDAEYIATQIQILADSREARPTAANREHPDRGASPGGVRSCRSTVITPRLRIAGTSPPTYVTFQSPNHPSSSPWQTGRSST